MCLYYTMPKRPISLNPLRLQNTTLMHTRDVGKSCKQAFHKTISSIKSILQTLPLLLPHCRYTLQDVSGFKRINTHAGHLMRAGCKRIVYLSLIPLLNTYGSMRYIHICAYYFFQSQLYGHNSIIRY